MSKSHHYMDVFKNYQTNHPQELKDQKLILQFLDRHDDALYRSNLVAHVTASAIITNQRMDKILFVYHNIYQSWSWVGGHNDGNPNMLEVAIEEALEETGLDHVDVYSEDLWMLDVVYVPNHIKHNEYVSDHVHLNGTYLLIADEKQKTTIKADENSGVKWFDIDDVLNHITEPRMKPIYQKAFDRIKAITSK